MSIIVGVHGVGQQFEGENSLRATWLPALKDGLARSGHTLTSDNDFNLAFYGDLFRSPGKKVAVDPPFDANDVTDEWEQELLEMWWREASLIEPAVRGPDDKTKVSVPSIVQRALNALSQSKFFASLAERALIFDLKQVHRYLHETGDRQDNEKSLRQLACERIEDLIQSNTRAIVGHSLGSVVAYEALCAHPEWPVSTLVTIGSPLGIRNLIFDKLLPPPSNGVGVWPGGIKHWINIADNGDIVALVKDLASRFGPRVADHLVDNGAKAHDATRYLTTQELGNAIALAL